MPPLKPRKNTIVLEPVTPFALQCVTWAMYNKLFLKILDSSIWLQPHPTRIVWFTLLAAMDEDGYAHFAAIENLAARARVTIDEAKAAIECFTSPDPDSSNPDNEGRRVERVPGGYMVLNAAAHRREFNRNIQREQTRQRVAKHRAKKGVTLEDSGNTTVTENTVTAPLHTVTAPLPNVTAVYENASESDSRKEGAGEKTKESGIPANEKEAIEWADMGMIPAAFAKRIYNQLEGRNWKDGAGQPVTNFRKHIKYRWQKEQETKAKEPPKMLDYAP